MARKFPQVPEALSELYNRCSAAIQSSAGIQVESFLDLEPKPDGTPPNPPTPCWKADMKARDYTPDDIKYVATVWQLAADAFRTQSVAEPTGGGGAEKGQEEGEDAEKQNESATVSDERRILRTRDGGSKPAARQVSVNAGRKKAVAKVRPSVEGSHGPLVTSDMRKACAFTQGLGSIYAWYTLSLRRVYACLTHRLLRVYAEFTQSLRTDFAEFTHGLRQLYAEFTHGLRQVYARCTQSLRECFCKVYAEFTHVLQGLRRVFAC